MGNRLNTRIKHTMRLASIKLYDKAGHILYSKVMVNDVTFFQQRWKVVWRDGK